MRTDVELAEWRRGSVKTFGGKLIDILRVFHSHFDGFVPICNRMQFFRLPTELSDIALNRAEQQGRGRRPVYFEGR